MDDGGGYLELTGYQPDLKSQVASFEKDIASKTQGTLVESDSLHLPLGSTGVCAQVCIIPHILNDMYMHA